VPEEDAVVTAEEEPIEPQEEAAEEAPQEDGEASPEGQPEAEEVARLRAALEERDARVAELEEEAQRLSGELTAALQKYRSSLLASAPEVPEELVQGETVHEVEEAFARARAMVDRIRSQVEAQAAKERIPPGAPARSGPDLSSLSAREKIAYALTRR